MGTWRGNLVGEENTHETDCMNVADMLSTSSVAPSSRNCNGKLFGTAESYEAVDLESSILETLGLSLVSSE